MFGMAKEMAVLLCVPILLFVAWREWRQRDRECLPQWRNGIALTGLLIISIHWLVVVLLDAPELLHSHIPGFIDLKWIVYHLSQGLDVAAIVLLFALKRVARLEAILAGMLMLVCWPGGYS
jgi:hypothetical protein